MTLRRSPVVDAAADEASADAARQRLRREGIVPIEPDERIRVMLDPGEVVAAVRRSVSLERRIDRGQGDRMAGDLYVTTQRLLYLGPDQVEYRLADIEDAVVTDRSLRLTVGDHRGVEIELLDPRVLRVEIAAVREAARAAAAVDTMTAREEPTSRGSAERRQD
jgi:hypothetical protein